jgi:hypothetical protein
MFKKITPLFYIIPFDDPVFSVTIPVPTVILYVMGFIAVILIVKLVLSTLRGR